MPISDAPDSMKKASIRRRRAPPGSGWDVSRTRLVRFKIPVAVADPTAMIMMEELCAPELHGHLLQDTAIDPRRTGKPYRYVYGTCVAGPRPCNSVNGVCRVDVVNGTVLMWSDSPRAIPTGPPTFLPRPGSSEDDETDGVLMVDCLGADGRAFLAILDGATFTEVARVVAPHRHCIAYCTTWVWGPQCH